ncbi:DUF4142 domain-containing protein [Hymenobacter oligotrophus]|nr:DUF4142 domain-containing protein [Hymenobacter oligotrophus]
MKTTSFFLVAVAVVLGSACSSSTSTTGTTGSSTSGSTVTNDASSGMTSGSSTSPGTSGSGSMNTSSVGTSSSVSGTGVSSGSMNVSGSTASSAPVGGTGAADINAFAATFASMDDPTFLMTAASSNMLEIQLGQMATQQSANADVKKYGQMMKDHHTKATQELKTVATPLNVTLPTALMPVHQALADKVAGKTGKAFDEAYMDAMETAHRLDIAMFEAKSKQASTPSVKALAMKTLPMLNSHQKMADEVEKKVD